MAEFGFSHLFGIWHWLLTASLESSFACTQILGSSVTPRVSMTNKFLRQAIMVPRSLAVEEQSCYGKTVLEESTKPLATLAISLVSFPRVVL
jgi:hypothetical protein